MEDTRKMLGIFRRLTVMLLITSCIWMTACGSAVLSRRIVGKWEGKMDIAAILSQEFSYELGMDLPLQPKYCDVDLEFYDDGTFALRIDAEEILEIIGELAEPISDMVTGYDTAGLVDMLLEYAAQQIPEDAGTVYGTYFVDDEAGTVTLMDEYGAEEVLRSEKGRLIMYEPDFGMEIEFRK
jgi:hypothetical protein